METKIIKVKVTLEEEMLGTANANPEIHEEFIASKAPDAPSREEEIAALGVEAVVEKGRTIFPKLEDGTPFLWDYQIKGFFKDACGMLRRVPDSKSKGLAAYAKVIDGLIFPEPRKIPIHVNGEIGECQRPLRAQTMQGERVTLANSETVPAGSWFAFDIKLLNPAHEAVVREWLDYMTMRGFGQWRNSGKGRATWEEIT